MPYGASRWRVRSIQALSLALALSACGGATQADAPAGGAGPTPAGGAPAVAGTGQGGSWAASGSAGQPEPGNPIAGLKLDDAFPWFRATGTGVSGLIEPEMDTGGNPVLHIGVEGEPAQATLSTHNHFEVVRYTSRVEFSAKSSEPLSLRVSVQRSLENADYFAALAAGELWPTATVEVETDWRSYSVPFSAMQPSEPEGATGSFLIAFIVDHPQSVELWVDDVRLE
jgi:hypothetical protein